MTCSGGEPGGEGVDDSAVDVKTSSRPVSGAGGNYRQLREASANPKGRETFGVERRQVWWAEGWSNKDS